MKNELISYGLSNKEIDIYLASLKAGECTANKLSELTSIRRSTVYEVIETLKKKGLITSFKKEKKSYFIASKPPTLINLLKEKERIIKEILPELESLSKSSTEKPEIKLIEGLSSIKAEVKKMLDSKEIYIYGAGIKGDITYSTFTSNFAKKRVANKVKMKAIIGESVPEHMLEKDVAKLTEIRKLSTLNDYQIAYFIYSDNLLILSTEEPLFAVSIKNPLIIKTKKDIFNLLWKIAKR